jgi:protein-disulfide isomerase-like protein with CxxC motif
MVCQRLALTALMILALASGRLLAAQPDRLDALARELDLSDRQKQQIKQIYADFDRKANPLIRQFCTHREEEWQALQNVLSEGGRAKVNEVLKAQEAKELQSIAQKLNLTEEQRERVEKIRKNFWKKFQNVCMQKGQNMARDYRQAYMEAVGAAREVLTPEQLVKLSAIQREDFHECHDFAVRPAHLNAIADQLGLSADQRKQIKQHCASCEKKCEQPQAEFKQLCKEECAALEKVLNAEQRAKIHAIFPFSFLAED